LANPGILQAFSIDDLSLFSFYSTPDSRNQAPRLRPIRVTRSFRHFSDHLALCWRGVEKAMFRKKRGNMTLDNQGLA
jgi:hypothetical protein